MSRSFYIYLHRRNDTGEVFYVGKGTKFRSSFSYKRAYKKSDRNKHWKNIVAKHGYSVEIFCEFFTEEDCIEKEIELIKFYGRQDLKAGTLVNKTMGGDGTKELHITEEQKRKISEKLKGRKLSESTRNKISNGLRGKSLSEEHKASISNKLKGKKLSEEHREKLSQKAMGRRLSDAHKRRLSESMSGKKWKMERKQQFSESRKGEGSYNYGKFGAEHPTSKPVKSLITGIVYGNAREASERENVSVYKIRHHLRRSNSSVQYMFA